MHRKGGVHGTQAEKRTEFGDGTLEINPPPVEDLGVDRGFY